MQNNSEKFSPLIEYMIPDAPLERKRKAQMELDGFMEVMYRIYQRLEAENKFPLPEDGSLTWPEDETGNPPSAPDEPSHGNGKTASSDTPETF